MKHFLAQEQRIVFGNMSSFFVMELFHIEPYISTIINFRLKYDSRMVAPNTDKKIIQLKYFPNG